MGHILLGGVGEFVTDVTGASCVSEEVSGKLNLGNFCFNSVGVRGVCLLIVCLVNSAALLQIGQLLEVNLCRPVQR